MHRGAALHQAMREGLGRHQDDAGHDLAGHVLHELMHIGKRGHHEVAGVAEAGTHGADDGRTGSGDSEGEQGKQGAGAE